MKELYSYVDGTPTHSYMRMLYRYPQAAFPYTDLLAENARRTTRDPEYELLDTGIFDQDRYFDITVEYAKASPDDILMRITAINRGPDPAPLHIIPQLWARNTWSWDHGAPRPLLRAEPGGVSATHPAVRDMWLDHDTGLDPVFCENETNLPLHFGTPAPGPFKDGINDLLVHGRTGAVSPHGQGTKCGIPVRVVLAPGATHQIRLRFRPAERAPEQDSGAFTWFDTRMQARRDEADEFYAALQTNIADPEARLVQRQALAGMLWSKQLYLFDVRRWLHGDPTEPPPPDTRTRDEDWQHVTNADIISMPDTWEYPWYAAWDLAFHCTTFALIDPAFAKAQLILILREWYMHPNGQVPAYEWNFGDVNPPVHAWAAWHVFEMDRTLTGVADYPFLERIFHKLMLNFTWWVNRKDADGRNLFQGGFLGLDNIGVFDRSKPLPTGGTLDQADGTAWMAMYCLNLLRTALELAMPNPVYEDTATKFFEHFLYIAEAMSSMGGGGLWDEQDGFFYDALRLPAQGSEPARMELMRVRSMVGLIPLMAVEVIGSDLIDRVPDFAKRLRWFLTDRPDLAELISRWAEPGAGERRLLSLLRGHRMKKLLERMLDEQEFLSPYGIRSLSKAHEAHPYVFEHGSQDYTVAYAPGNGLTRLFGGNSNWRGPVWFPVNALLIESLRRFHDYYGDDFLIECPVGSGQMRTLSEVADHIRVRLIALFLPDAAGRRPTQAGKRHWPGEPALEFHEFFHGDTGEGLGASHQTGWTGLVALIIQNHGDVRTGVKLPADPGAAPPVPPPAPAPSSPSTLPPTLPLKPQEHPPS